VRAIFSQVDTHQPIPAVLVLKHSRVGGEGRVNPIDEHQYGLEIGSENFFPLEKVGDVAFGGPGFKDAATGLLFSLAAFDVDEEIFSLFAVDDEIEGFESCVGEEGALGLVDGDVGDFSIAQKGFERGFVMDGSYRQWMVPLRKPRDGPSTSSGQAIPRLCGGRL
jgi:hypothetical protein